jgi:predicted dehydrogenase
VNYAVLGLGSIGVRHAKIAERIRQICGIERIRAFDISPERRAQFAQPAAGTEVVASLEEAVSDAHVVVVCVPTSKHIPVVEALRSLGQFHLFIEKPLSHTLEGCDELVFAQQRAGKVTAVGYLLRFHPVLARLREMISTGMLGRVLTVRAESGFFLPQWHPWEDYRDFYMSWKTGGGGALLDTSHEINYLQWIFGRIVEVKGYFDTVSDLEISSDDLALAHCRFESGAYGEVHLDLLQFDESRYCKVIGTEAVAVADLISNTIRSHRRGDKDWTTETFKVNYDDIYDAEVREFLQVCRTGGKLTSPASDALETMHVIEGVRRSHSFGVAVRLPVYG